MLLLALVFCFQSTSAFALAVHGIAGQTMGTSYSVKYITKSEKPLSNLKSTVDHKLELVNERMSTWRKKSELSRFNSYPKTDWFPVSKATAETAQQALKVGRQTNGAFDVTIGKIVNMWGFGPEKRPTKVPNKKDLGRALKENGNDKLEVRLNPPALKKANPRIYVDLSGIAKGYGVDVVAAHKDSLVVNDYMVEIGGEVRLKGSKPNKVPWKIAIERPQSGIRKIHHVLIPGNNGMATSGDYRNYFAENGKRYSHLIDPRNGNPISHNVASVTVIAKTSMEADAYATALIVLGAKDGLAIAEKNKIAALFLVRENGKFKDITTKNFNQYRAK